MTETIGRGVIEVSADASKLKAGIADAQRSLKGLGDSANKATKGASDGIDRYVKRLELQAAVQGKSTREAELYKLSLRGASAQQLIAANSALKLNEAYERGVSIGDSAKRALLGIGVAAVAGTAAALVAFDRLISGAAKFQDVAEKVGDSAENFASLAVAAGTAGVPIDSIAAASVKLTKNLTGVDDESKAAGAALTSLGLDVKAFKDLKPADQFDAVAQALDTFGDSTKKTAVAVALLGKSGADLLPFFKELAKEGGRQVILTETQIALADDFTDKQAKLRTEFTLQAQVFAISLIPTIAQYAETLKNVLKDQDNVAAATGTFKFALEGVVSVFRTVAVFAISLGAAFDVMGTSIGAAAAQVAALARLDFKGFSLIGRESSTDIDKIFDKAERRTKALFADQSAPKFIDPRLLGSVGSIAEQTKNLGKKELKFDGVAAKGKEGKDTAAQEAKAKLAFELDQIKKAGDASANTIANQQRLLEAQRTAGLVEERAFYAEKLSLLNSNTLAQENALQLEIARLQTEKLSGKEKIDNDRKILDSQSKLAKVREDAAVNVKILSIQETAALQSLAQQYRDAEDAATDFLDTLRRAQSSQLAGVGIGNAARDRLAGRGQIEDRFSEQRRSLEKSRRDAELSGSFGPDAQAKYDQELDRIRRFQAQALSEYESFVAKRKELDTSFGAGASEGIANYLEDVRNVAQQSEELMTNAFKGMESALVDFVKTGKLDFKSLADQIITDLIRIQVRQNITGPLAQAVSSGGSSIFSGLKSLLGFADGGRPPVGVPSLVGERGPELFIPNSQGTIIPNNALGALGGSAVTVNQTVSIDARGSEASVVPMIEAAMRRTKAETLAAVQANANRGGSFARSVGRA